jgi:hypothetical protein
VNGQVTSQLSEKHERDESAWSTTYTLDNRERVNHEVLAAALHPDRYRRHGKKRQPRFV